jgi:TonB family protein
MKRSDSALTFALCVSLTAHAGLWGLVIHQQISDLNAKLHSPPLVDLRSLPDDETDERTSPVETPAPLAPVIQQPTQVVQEPKPLSLPKPPPPKPEEHEYTEWGEKDKTGFALTSTPGKEDLKARKGAEDQAFASRDPQGPEVFPDDPSMSTVPPGQNGDGGKSSATALAEKGTQSNENLPVPTLSNPAVAMTPPAPLRTQRTVAAGEESRHDSEVAGRATSILPANDKQSPAQGNAIADAVAELPNDPALGAQTQILPIKRRDVIGIRSNKPAYPDVVVALTQPPGIRISPPQRDPLNDAALASIVHPDVTGAPAVQPATAALDLSAQPVDEMAERLGANDPRNAPAVVEALTHAPGDTALDGNEAALGDLVLADRPDAAPVQDAIIALTTPDERPDEEIAEQLQVATPPPPVVVAQNKTEPTPSHGGVPGPAVPAADPAADTGLESDPFAKIPGVEFRDGKVEARSGRQIKPVRPRLTEAGMRDLLAQQFPTVLLKVKIDKTGKVVDVNIVRGSGSEAVDMPVYRALWGWWFEPPRDKKGNPMEDVQLVAIHWG